VNDCGIKDSVLLLSQFLVLFTGMAGRLGFNGGTGRNFRNRFFDCGHSGYFLGAKGQDDSFMTRYWLPLLASEADPEIVDIRKSSAISGIYVTLLNNAEPIKLALYMTPVIAFSIWISGLYLEADRQRAEAVRAGGVARAQSLAAFSDSTRLEFPQRSLLLAVEAAETTRRMQQPIEPIATRALIDSLGSVGGTPHFNEGIYDIQRDVMFSPGSGGLITSSAGATTFWDLNSTGSFKVKRVLNSNLMEAKDVSRDGERILTYNFGNSGPVYVWYADSDGTFKSSNLGTMRLDESELSDDGHWAITAAAHSAVLWNLTAANSPKNTGLGSILSYRFSYDNRALVFCDEKKIASINLLNNEHTEAVANSCESLKFSRDNKKVATIDSNGTLQVWSIENGAISPAPDVLTGEPIPSDVRGLPWAKVWFTNGNESILEGGTPQMSASMFRNSGIAALFQSLEYADKTSVKSSSPTPHARIIANANVGLILANVAC
jgi:hypothetical protein